MRDMNGERRLAQERADLGVLHLQNMDLGLPIPAGFIFNIMRRGRCFKSE
jgi:hypothetical protein